MEKGDFSAQPLVLGGGESGGLFVISLHAKVERHLGGGGVNYSSVLCIVVLRVIDQVYFVLQKRITSTVV